MSSEMCARVCISQAEIKVQSGGPCYFPSGLEADASAVFTNILYITQTCSDQKPLADINVVNQGGQ